MARATTLLTLALLGVAPSAAPASAVPLADPAVAEGGKTIVLTAKRGDADIPGYGTVTGAYLYHERFTADGHAAPQETEGLLVPVWHVEPGERLRITLQNQLGIEGAACDDTRTNLHTHGLLVGPWTAAQSPFGKLGDFVLTDTLPSRCPGTPPGPHAHGPAQGASAEYEILVPRSHPSGLFWYHPHSHGLSGRQVGGGMAGLIAVGKLSDYAQVVAARGAYTFSGRGASSIESHFLTLKDMQVGSDHAYVEDPDPTLCADSPDPNASRAGKCTSKDGGTTWLFPVNGQLHPNIAVRPAGQVWRIGNTSPSATYRLALLAGDDPLCMQVLARDGVPVVETGGGAPDRVFESEIILMPGSRVELFAGYDDALNLDGSRHTARGTACGRHGATAPATLDAELVTLGFDTGSNPPGTSPDDAVGDPWPFIQLAGVQLQRGAAAPAGSQMHVIRPVAATSPAATLRQRVMQAASPARAAAPLAAAAHGCGPDGAPESKADPALGQIRVIWFGLNRNDQVIPPTAPDRDPGDVKTWLGAEDDSDTFELANEVRDAVGNRLFPPGPVKLQVFDPARTDLCVRAGHREIWRLVNLTEETHNFHIHQSKFRVLDVHDPFDQLRHEAPWALSPDQAHDVYPVPKFGYVDIEIGFGAPSPGPKQDPVGGLTYTRAEVGNRPLPVQVGRFVFHCHILEHEDGGMMAIIEVLPPVPDGAETASLGRR